MARAIIKHLIQLLKHKWFVLVAGIRVGGIPIWRLLIHDWSKFTPAEFFRYARNFHLEGEKPQKADLDFAYGWLHHENLNPHHWGFWIPRSGKFAGKPLPMPRSYVREMFADWMGASRAYTGSWEMGDWLSENLPYIAQNINYPHTANHLIHVLQEHDYWWQATTVHAVIWTSSDRVSN